MPIFYVSEDVWRAYPGAAAGFLVMRNVANPEHSPALDQQKEALQESLHTRFTGQEPSVLLEMPVIRAYARYYKKFKQNYHVAMQLESVVWKGRPIQSSFALVEAMFLAELQHLLLTAGHDLDAIVAPIQVNVATGEERYITLNGKEQALKPGDLYMADRQGVISSILYGPDLRTRLQPSTRNVVFAVYAPPGIVESRVYGHLRAIQNNVLLAAPDAVADRLVILSA